MPILNSLEHHAKDFNEEVGFFKDVLGFPVVRETADKAAVFQVTENFRLTVYPRDPSHPPYADFRGDTLCLGVDSAQEVDRLAKEMKRKGVPIRLGPITSPTGYHSFFMETPSGLTIEFGCRA